MNHLFPDITVDEVLARSRSVLDAETLRGAAAIVEDVRRRGEQAAREHAERLGDIEPGQPIVVGRTLLDDAARTIDAEDRAVLERTAARIRRFAEAQATMIRPIDCDVDCGRAGQSVAPVSSAGCYAPGGRYPLPSSVLMTVIPARVAGVEQVWVASPRPAPVTLAAASIAGADGLLAIGGAQAIAALAHGVGGPPRCDVICGPGNRWVTAAKHLVSRECRVDMLAGPSELVVVADDSANPAWIAADLLAQAEHDTDALPVLVGLSEGIITHVRTELTRQLGDLPTAATARVALRRGGAIVARSIEEAAEMCHRIAPEHLQLSIADARTAVGSFRNHGALFIGERSGEVFGDYGAGPNHVLPTGGAAVHSAGLSVFTFVRLPTWIESSPQPDDRFVRDVIHLARLEGLEAHARAAAQRLSG